MALFTKESLETLRQRIDLLEVIQPHVELKRAGATYKGICPFHDERTPSFTVNKGDSHYHCYGCGAHGDAIQFLTEHQRLSFHDAVETLARRFNVVLEVMEDRSESTGPRKADLKACLQEACRLYHFLLLHTAEGHMALQYLYDRGIALDFIQQFQLGWAPKLGGVVRKALQAKSISDELMVASGLIAIREDGSKREFFSERILFPIRDATGAVIGFSARKIYEETFGGKYINTIETALFKKSRVLFGLNYCRKRIAKEQLAIVVEGQIDALRLIHAGLNITVAGLGTAFGEGHVSELAALGVRRVYLALDADRAGQEATRKIGNLFQKEGIEVSILELPAGEDPDSLLRARGVEAFVRLMEHGIDYMTFLVRLQSKERDISSPAAKAQMVKELSAQVRGWNHPVMVHESLKKLAQLLQVPDDLVGVGGEASPNYMIRKSASAGLMDIDPDRILESDLLRWMILSDERRLPYIRVAASNLKPQDLRVAICAKLFASLVSAMEQGRSLDLLSLMSEVADPDCQQLMAELMQKHIDKAKGKEILVATIKRILDRNWMEKCEVLRMRIQSGGCSDDEVSVLAQEFGQLKRNPPKVVDGEPIHAS